MLQAANPKSKKNHYFLIYKKTINHKNSQKAAFGRYKKVLHRFPKDIASQFLALHAVNWQFIFQQITHMAIAQVLDQKKEKKFVL